MNNDNPLSNFADNPFDTSKCNFSLSFQIEYQNYKYFEDFLEFASDSVSFKEISSKTIESMPEDIWELTAYFPMDPSGIVESKIRYIAEGENIEISQIIIRKLEDKDWVTEAQKNFKPFAVSRFFISSEFYKKEALSQNLHPIIIDPSRAFGTGEHSTTKGCIEAMDLLSDIDFRKIADVGTGTGILAIAAQKIWKSSSVTASDIEKVSCEIAKHNSFNNDCPKIDILHSDGYKEFADKKFDLIISNILLQPLLDYADDLKSHLNKDGYVILSGFLKNQNKKLTDRFESIGFDVENTLSIDGWSVVTLKINR